METLLKRKKTYSVLGFIFALALFTTPVFAGDNLPAICNPPQSFFGRIRELFDKSIRETVMNMLTSSVQDFGFHVATGSDMQQMVGCSSYAMSSCAELATSFLTQASACEIEDPDNVCPSLYNQYRALGDPNPNARLASSQSAGSLMGIAYSLKNTLQTQPLPVNMAYFFRDYARRVPIVGERAFAAEPDYAQFGLNQIYDLWRVMRNISYALMSLVILVIGIMIIMRQKISQQVVVNVQYALPKVALTIIFITFSYPIGAAIASVSWAVFHSVDSIVSSIAGSFGESLSGGQAILACGLDIGIIITGLLIAFVGSWAGLAGGIAIVIAVIICLILYLAVMVKAFFIYLKMLVNIVVAPLQFVFGAIPGNDDQTVMWFKKMAVYGLSLVGMQFVVYFTMMIVAQLLFAETQVGGTLADYLSGALYVVFGLPLLLFFGFGFAFKVPSMIEGALLNQKKR